MGDICVERPRWCCKNPPCQTFQIVFETLKETAQEILTLHHDRLEREERFAEASDFLELSRDLSTRGEAELALALRFLNHMEIIIPSDDLTADSLRLVIEKDELEGRILDRMGRTDEAKASFSRVKRNSAVTGCLQQWSVQVTPIRPNQNSE